jgi:hypothetical protein
MEASDLQAFAAVEKKRVTAARRANPDAEIESESPCPRARDAFDQCVTRWRADPAVGSKPVRGAGRGEPPPQCGNISCLVAQCLGRTGYDFGTCGSIMNDFKHCVTKLYGKPYIEDEGA